jgi:malonyl-CoA O-methyltransferase
MKTQLIQEPEIDKALIKRSFEKAACHYNQFTSLQRTIGDRLMKNHVSQSGKETNVLDIGAGTGYLTGKILRAMPSVNVVALDLSIGMLQQTRINLNHERLGFVTADADKLSVRSASMDKVFSNLAFQWCSNLPMTFSASYAALKPKGQFVFATFGPNTLRELKKSWLSADTLTHVNNFVDHKTVESNLKTSGFVDVIVKIEKIVLYYQSPKQLMLDLKGMGAHNINSGRQHGLTGVDAYKKMIAAYEKLRTKEGVPATFEAIYAYANK